MNKSIYKGYCKETNILMNSSSGGIFGTLATDFIHERGLVVGCIWDKERLSTKHVIIDKTEQLEPLLGSKYVRSDLSGSFVKIKHSLEDGKKVLFCGTPCQIAGLRNYFKEQDELLYTIDLICYGVGEVDSLRKYVEEVEKIFEKKVTDVNFRTKKAPWEAAATEIVFGDGVSLVDYDNLWFKAFNDKALVLCESCYKCNYHNLNRFGDITLGDFWNTSRLSCMNKKKGISAIIINNQKGRSLFNKIEHRITYKSVSIEEIIGYNPGLTRNAERPPERDLFMKLINFIPFSKAYCICDCIQRIRKACEYK